MRRRGFGLIDTIIGIFFIGLIVVTILPLPGISSIQYTKINAQTEMIYIGESIYERLCSEDEYSRNLIEELMTRDEVIFDDLSDEYLDKYESKIKKTDEFDSYIDIKIIINSKSDGGHISDVEFQGSILK